MENMSMSYVEVEEIEQPENYLFQSRLMSGPSDIKANLTCFICQRLKLDPQECANPGCEVSLCSRCLSKWRSENSGCPSCDGTHFKRQKSNSISDDFLNQIRFDCPYINNKSPYNACDTVNMKYEEFKKHVNECKFALFECTSPACKKLLKREERQLHIHQCPHKLFQCIYCMKTHEKQYQNEHTSICPKRKVACKYCSIEIIQIEQANHEQKQCESFTLKCNECNQSMQRKKLDEHKLECPELPRKCQCGIEVKYKDYESHMKSCESAQIVCTKCFENISYGKKDQHRNEDCIRNLAKKCQQIETDIKVMQLLVNDIQTLLQQQQNRIGNHQIYQYHNHHLYN